MIVKKRITQKDIREFFQFELNKLDKSLGLAILNTETNTIKFDSLGIEILKLNLDRNTEYIIENVNIYPRLQKYLAKLDINTINKNEELIYSDIKNEEIIIKVTIEDKLLKLSIISMQKLLSTESQLMHLNKVLQASNNIFSVSTWWKDYDQHDNKFYQTDIGAKLLGVDLNEKGLYSVAEFQKVRDKAAVSSPFYDECIKEERVAFELVRNNKTDYFGGRTPAFTVDNEEIWVEAYGICILRYPDGSPRFFVAVDIYLSDIFEKSNQIAVLNSLINQGLNNSNIGIWYYNKFHDEGRYYFTESQLKVMKLDTALTNETVSQRLDDHFESVVMHTPSYKTYLDDWRETHSKVFTEGLDSYTKVIPNNIDKDIPQWVEVRGNVLERDEAGEVKLFVGVNVDVTETVARNLELEKLRQENERLQLAEKLAIKAGNVLVWYQNFDESHYDKYIYGNEMFSSRLGIKRNEKGLFSIASLRKSIIKSDKESKILSRQFIEKLNALYTNDSNGFHDLLVKHKNTDTGKIVYFEHTAEIEERFEDGSVKLIGGFMRDVSDRVERQKKIAFLANNDILTGLRNRNYFDTFISSGALPPSYSVLMFDLDGLKLINDAFGHMDGDNAIRLVAKFLTDVFTDNIIIARIGGDEFLIITQDIDPVTITENANKLEEKLENYNRDSAIEINVSKGGYVVEDNDVEFDKAFIHAENLMYRRKLMNRSSRKSKVLESILETLNQKTEETKEHSDRIEIHCLNICKSLGISRASDLEDLRLLAKVHDIGKVTVPDYILNKPGRLSDDEFEIVKKHSEAGYKIIKNITDSDFVCEAVLSHHEKFDGTGYPQGLSGKNIPLFARIISVADAFDAMTNDRVYHKGISDKEAIEEIIRCSGTHFDPDIVQAFIKSHFNVDLN